MPKYFTVVYEVHDEDKFRQIASEAAAGMLSPPDRIARLGFDITGCGWGDSMTRADAHAAVSDYSDEEALDLLLRQEDEDISEVAVKRRVKEIVG
jgi:hypothetical protein